MSSSSSTEIPNWNNRVYNDVKDVFVDGTEVLQDYPEDYQEILKLRYRFGGLSYPMPDKKPSKKTSSSSSESSNSSQSSSSSSPSSSSHSSFSSTGNRIYLASGFGDAEVNGAYTEVNNSDYYSNGTTFLYFVNGGLFGAFFDKGWCLGKHIGSAMEFSYFRSVRNSDNKTPTGNYLVNDGPAPAGSITLVFLS